ncbi:hypothetical protein [Terribacillus saccharophilus]|uniref:hypothetical protein n=1 Tax=Terribacillus saccharophilus TaxID=361277 RepID=UPI002DCCF946|nr:hypothetical protein [Terribacillus saccharophilus]
MFHHDLSALFDQDYNQDYDMTDLAETTHYGQSTAHADNILFNYEDPLKYANKYQFDPFQFNSPADMQFVDPHPVSSYVRSDGTVVDSYYRDGDGNPDTQLTKDEGGGWFRKDT